MSQKSSFLLGFAALFLATAILGLWAAYDQKVAFLRFAFLAIGGIAVVVAGTLGRQQRMQFAPYAAWGGSLLAGAVAVYYLATRQGGHDAFGGITGSALAILLPFPLANLLRTLRNKQWPWVLLSVLLVLVGGVGLFATRERGAMLSLLAGGAMALLFWLLVEQNVQASSVRLIRWLIWSLGLLALIGYGLFVIMPSVASQVGAMLHLHPDSDILGRRELWNNAIALMSDYPFTGSGLGSVPMALASYVYISHVANQPHVHNLLLQVGTEQGWLGALAMAGMLVLAVMVAMEALPAHTRDLQELRLASIASTITLFVYGLLDAELYAYSTVPLTFAPIAFALLVRSSPRHQSRRERKERNELRYMTWAGIGLALIAVGIWLNGAKLRSALFANLAAIDQSKAELSVYNYQIWGVQDRLRRKPDGVNLDATERYFQIALVIDAQNESALRRSGQIALAQGDYDKAGQMLQSAYQLAPEHRANRQLLGEALAVRGQIDEAAQLWQSVSFLDSQLEGRAWWYEQLQELQAAKNIHLAMAKIAKQ
ncbi:MAG: O-antigen ligase family protein [Caldilineaceae bacterium]